MTDLVFIFNIERLFSYTKLVWWVTGLEGDLMSIGKLSCIIIQSCFFYRYFNIPRKKEAHGISLLPDSGVDVCHPVRHLGVGLRSEHTRGLLVRREDFKASCGLLPRDGLPGQQTEV